MENVVTEEKKEGSREVLVKKTVILPPWLAEAGVAQAKKDLRSFSSYVNKLIQQDVVAAGKQN